MGKVLIVDDHPVIRLAVKLLLEREGHTLVGETDNGVDALSIIRESRPDLVILDIGIPKIDGLEVLARISTLKPRPRVLILTSQPADLLAFRCMKAGAAGFITKGDNLEELQRAVWAALSGYSFFPTDILSTVNPTISNSSEHAMLNSLSDREIMVLQMLAQGKSNKEIGDSLLLSNKTISTYKTRLQLKLNAFNLVALVDFAKRNGLG
ncbi:response regulator transcription factor [Pseudomonas sp. GV071]|jgi:two-component system response regulator EvgA|uniref:response regulator transcription factor n=1 Tax=Pseudomonas sp. GV071 TaxID=2135754 RepID=UPI000D3624D9|nr:response regulator transcription factor [Pseudomonas sp. GV071]PTQ68509.1 LuxR family two component transcriptional regulator [Pseudomonas sp. GV071]